jgi:hypothetical protein
VTAFTGGISNSGSIVAAAYGIVVTQVSAFAGGVTNNGKISAGGVSGAIFVNNVGNFSGGIVNAAGALISAQTSESALSASPPLPAAFPIRAQSSRLRRNLCRQ